MGFTAFSQKSWNSICVQAYVQIVPSDNWWLQDNQSKSNSLSLLFIGQWCFLLLLFTHQGWEHLNFYTTSLCAASTSMPPLQLNILQLHNMKTPKIMSLKRHWRVHHFVYDCGNLSWVCVSQMSIEDVPYGPNLNFFEICVFIGRGQCFVLCFNICFIVSPALSFFFLYFCGSSFWSWLTYK